MGKRRIRNLNHLKAGEVVGVDAREDRRREVEKVYGITTHAAMQVGLDANPDAVIISLPPDLHTQFALEAARRGKHFFTEAGVLEEGMEELISATQKAAVVGAPSCTLRFHPAVRTIKRLLSEDAVGRPTAFTYHSGQYLPDWHPWEDYRTFYAARRLTGACREIVPFELTWLTDLFGPVARVAAARRRIGDLDVDIDDVYQVLLEFQGSRPPVGHLLVEVLARTPRRVFRLVGVDGLIEWDWQSKVVRAWSASTKQWTSHPVDEGAPEAGYVVGEQMYIDEMRAFLEAIHGRARWPHSLAEDLRVLRTLRAAEESSDTGRWVDVAEGGAG